MRWTGQIPAHQGTITCLARRVHRFKIDEEQRTVIATFRTGGLMVASIEDDAPLWTLRTSREVRRNAHCEYDGGFLVFDRVGSTLEIWRRKRDSQADPLPSSPDARQILATRTVAQSPESVRQNDRGAFVPFRVISPPHDIYAYRFVYPSLLAASEDPQEAYIFDVRTGDMSQRISMEIDPEFPIEINYVDLSMRHVFVCTEAHGLVIFSRAPSSDPPFIKFQPTMPAFQEAFDVRVSPVWPQTGVTGFSEIPLEIGVNHLVDSLLDPGRAVHVSPCGLHLVFVTCNGFVYIIRHFESILGQPHPPKHSIMVISMPSPITNMALEEDRIALYAVNLGLLVIPFASQTRVPVTSLANPLENPWPRLYQAYSNIRSILHFPRWNLGPDVYCSCVQMNRTSVWFVSFEITGQEEEEGDLLMKSLRYVDFSRSPSSETDENRVIPAIKYD